jgi:hypothetical protein
VLVQARKGLGIKFCAVACADLQADGTGAGKQVQPPAALRQAGDIANARMDHGEHRRAHLRQGFIGFRDSCNVALQFSAHS